MKNQKIIAPLIDKLVTADTRDEYLSLVKEASMDAVFLAISDFGCSDSELDATRDHLAENISFFKDNGIEANVWIGVTIGHGAVLTGADRPDGGSSLLPLVNVKGQAIPDTRCPLDPNFRRELGKYVREIARSGARIILLDDDFRLSQHGPEFCCACENHMKLIREKCGEDITREELVEYAFTNKADKYRRAWLDAEGESLKLLSASIREAVDSVDPDITVGICSPHSLWDIDGTTPIELAEILAGKNKPFIRLHSAPYSAVLSGKPLPHVFDLARMFASFTRGMDYELIAEGDVYPRPRYYIPSSYLELYDSVIRADGGFTGIMKYIFDYVSAPDYERSYVKHHCHEMPYHIELSRLFEGKDMCGVSVPVRPNLLRDADLSRSSVTHLSPYPWAGIFLGFNSIPTTYGRTGIATALFGEEARHVDLSEIEKGAVLDAVSAVILSERGVDVGLGEIISVKEGRTASLTDVERKVRAAVWNGRGRIWNATVSDNATPVMTADIDGEEMLFAYSYTNSDGQKFLVYLLDSSSLPVYTGIPRGYLEQDVLIRHLEWIAGERLPAKSTGNPDLYVMCGRGSEDGSLAVLLLNCYADRILEPEITLDREYKSIRFIGCSGTLSGNKVKLDRPIGAFESCAFEVL